MPRGPAHFKIHVSAANHRRLQGLWVDDALLAMWVRAGVMCIVRFADRTSDRCLVSKRDLLVVANTEPWSNAIRKLRRLVAATPLRLRCDCAGSPLEARCDCAGIWLEFPNFTKKQGFLRGNGVATGPSASASASASQVGEEEEQHASHVGVSRRRRGRAENRSTIAPWNTEEPCEITPALDAVSETGEREISAGASPVTPPSSESGERGVRVAGGARRVNGSAGAIETELPRLAPSTPSGDLMPVRYAAAPAFASTATSPTRGSATSSSGSATAASPPRVNGELFATSEFAPRGREAAEVAPGEEIDAWSEQRAERLVNLLSRQPGTREDKLAWLGREWETIHAMADEDHPDDPRRRAAAVRSRVLRHYRHQLRGGGPGGGGGRPLRVVRETVTEHNRRSARELLFRMHPQLRPPEGEESA